MDCAGTGERKRGWPTCPAMTRFEINATRLPICAKPERLSASRPRLFGAVEFRSRARRAADGSCCGSRISTRRAAGRNSRPRSIRTSRWLGLSWETPVRRQSEHFAFYREAVEKLSAQGLVYPAFESRAEIARLVAQREAEGAWPRDPDGAPLYPGTAKLLPPDERRRLIERRRALRAAARHGGGLRAGRRSRPGPSMAKARMARPARSPPGPRPGATSSWRARKRRPATICRS